MESTEQSRRTPRWAEFAAGILAMVVLLHLVATFLWIAPSNAIREAVADPLDSYMDPMFDQNWSLFAPTPIGVQYALQVRSFDDAFTPTEWYDATAVEMTQLEHRPFPSRVSRMSRNLASRLAAQHRALEDGEREELAKDFNDDAWERLADRMAALPDRSSSARRSLTLRLDRATAAYATQVSHARHPEQDTAYVQVRIVSQRTPEFGSDAAPEPSTRTLGRRPAIEQPGQDTASFVDAFNRFRG